MKLWPTVHLKPLCGIFETRPARFVKLKAKQCKKRSPTTDKKQPRPIKANPTWYVKMTNKK